MAGAGGFPLTATRRWPWRRDPRDSASIKPRLRAIAFPTMPAMLRAFLTGLLVLTACGPSETPRPESVPSGGSASPTVRQVTATVRGPLPYSATPHPSLRPPALANGRVVLTDQHDGMSVSVPVGTLIDVEFPAQPSPYAWTAPQTSAPTVVAVLTDGQGSDGSARGTFRVVQSGTSVLTASAAPHCAPGCKAGVSLWRVHITATG